MRSLFALLLLFGLTPGIAAAQAPVLPIELLPDNVRRLQGDRISLCILADGPTMDLERAIGSAIADTLLVEVTFHEVPNDFPLYEEVDFLHTVYVLLIERCDAFMGFSLVSGGYPDWLTFSRPYVEIPFVLAVTDPETQRLSDVPLDQPLGTQMMSVAEAALITYQRALPAERRWRTYPYGDPELMLTRLLDGTIAGAFFWAPLLQELLRERGAEPSAVRIAASTPITIPPARLGFAMPANQTYLRSLLDQAIGTLIAEGEIDALLDSFDIEGSPGPG